MTVKDKTTTEANETIAGNAAMREALVEISKIADDWEFYGTTKAGALDHIYELANAALAAPPRNCDLPLVGDSPAYNNADKAWLVFKRHNPDAYFDVSGLLRCINWLFTVVTDEGEVK